MSSEHNKAVVRKAIDALSRGDMAGFLADAADDVSFTLIGSTPLSGTIRGKNTIEQGLTTILGERLEGGAAEAQLLERSRMGEVAAGDDEVGGLAGGDLPQVRGKIVQAVPLPAGFPQVKIADLDYLEPAAAGRRCRSELEIRGIAGGPGVRVERTGGRKPIRNHHPDQGGFRSRLQNVGAVRS